MLDEQHALKLRRLAERAHTSEGTIARVLLSRALDESDPDPRSVAALLDGIPGAAARLELGRRQARTGNVVPLNELGAAEGGS